MMMFGIRKLADRGRRRATKKERLLETLEPRQVLAGDPLVDGGNPIVISEIMYHPSSENDLEEFIELTNVGSVAVKLTDWTFTSGVSFKFPDTTLESGKQLVIARDLATFGAQYPLVKNVVGGWTGQLSDGSESITLKDATGQTIDQVEYADEGDWSLRAVGPLDRGHRGWIWQSEHDGLGSSLELVNTRLPNQWGENWRSSKVAGGTPGAPNSVAELDSAPLILEVAQSPIIPRSTDSVTVTARLLDELPAGSVARLHWRVDGAASFTNLPMLDDGAHGDELASDGIFGAVIPANANGKVVEYFITAEDGGGKGRSYPAQADSQKQPAANRLYQVDNAFDPNASWTPGSQPIYRLVMTEAERAELGAIGRNVGNSADSNAQMNGTFIVVDGTGLDVRYNVGIRNRGHGSRIGPPNNYRVNLAKDRPWNDVTELNFNSRTIHAQLLGAAIFQMAGIVAADATATEVRVNGQDLAQPAGGMFGSYVLLESMNSDAMERHFPLDSEGNLYSAFRLDDGSDEADLAYEGTNPNTYRNRYFKGTNQEKDDWSDLIALTNALNNSPEENYVQVVGQHVNIDQWLRYLALDALLLNRETGLNRGIGDDYSFYRGVDDSRFVLVPHDLDTIMQQGNDAGAIDQSIFTFREVDGLNRFLRHPEIVARFYGQFEDLIETTFNPTTLNPLIDQLLGPFVPSANIAAMKKFVVDRTAAVLAQIPQAFRIDQTLPIVNGLPRTTSSTVSLQGTANSTETLSVLVDGRLADYDATTGKWKTPGASSGGQSETLTARGAAWRYLDDGTNQSTAWKEFAFDDTAWKQGPAQLGYGDNDEATVVNGGPTGNRFITTYFRRQFTVDDPSAYTSLVMNLLRDDGAVVYLNGTELTRSNMPAKPAAIDYTTRASTNISGAAEGVYGTSTFTAETSLLRAGKNVLAVEIHQSEPSSADISFDLELQATRQGTGTGGVPLQPGINRVLVEAFAGPLGTGELVDSGYLDVWFDGAATNSVLWPEPIQAETLNMLTRASYLPGSPMVVRIEALDSAGKPLRELWDATVTLSTDTAQVRLSTYEVKLRNGVGSALVIPNGSGDFTLTASLGDTQVTRRVLNASGVPVTTVSGSLPGTSTTWSGVVRVTADVAVPAGHTLTILPDTLVLFAGNATPLSTNGADLIVEGTIRSLGTADRPVTFTAADPNAPWGEIHHKNAGTSQYVYTQITRAGHAPRDGHTNTGPAIRTQNSTISFDHVDITDIAGKIMNGSDSNLTFQHSQFARSVMGPEITGSGLVFEDGFIVDMLGIYREDGVTDDNDGIYIHRQGAGQTIRISRSVIAHTDDDGIDTLGPDMTMEDLIIRDLTNTKDDPKAITIINGTNTIRNVLMANVDIGISAKGQGGTTPKSNNTIEHVTIQANSIGIQAENKFGIPGAIIDFNIRNSIVSAPDPVKTDYSPSSIVVNYSNLVGETWAGTGNLSQNPLFVNPLVNDFRLQPGSPSVDAGNPASTPDADGSRADQGYYRSGKAGQIATQTLSGALTGNVILAPWRGPYVVTGNVTVPAGSSVTVLPGTTVTFQAGASMTFNGGRLIAEGTEHEPVRFTRVPGGDKWAGLQFSGSMLDNRISHAVLEYGGTSNNQGMVGLDDSNLTIENTTLDHADRRRIRSRNSSLIVRNSVFTDVFPGVNEAPTTDNLSEHIWGGGIPAGGHFIIENNVFGRLKGHNDGIDFDAPRAPNPIPQILGNVFLGGGDDALDMTGDYLIEGNSFMHFQKDKYNQDPGQSNVLSSSAGNYTVVRNTFYDAGHAAIVKEGAFMDFIHNTVVNLKLSALYFDLAGQTTGPGRGAHVVGSVFEDTPIIFSDIIATTDAQIHDSIVPAAWLNYGSRNTSENPRLTDPAQGDFELLPGSPALDSGPNGLDRGAVVPGGASVSGEPPARTANSAAQLKVDGPGIVKYQYRVNNGDWSEVRNVSQPIELTNLANGSYTVYVRGQNVAGVWQDSNELTASRTWVVDKSLQRLVISEVLASNVTALDHQGTRPDAIELYNGGASPVNLLGMSITDGGANPKAFVLPQLVLQPGQYLTIFADKASTAGLHTGFGLDADGDGVFLYSAQPDRVLLDSVEFGIQVDDRSIARVGPAGDWMLADPTFGSANVAARTGDPATLVINEWLAAEDVAFADDFIELYNPDPLPVPLAGLGISDTVGFAQDIHTIAPLSFVGGLGYVDFHADGDTSKGPSHLAFGLGYQHEVLSLLQADGRVIDRLVYQPQTTDVSQGRTPDGAVPYGWFNLPTPGLSNAESTNPRMLGLLASLRISEMMYAPEGGSEYEYIELQNVGSQSLDITGVRLEGGVEFTFPSRTIPAGGYAVVANDLVAFAQRYGNISTLAGEFSGNLNNGGEEIILKLPEKFEAAILRFEYDGAWYPRAADEGRSLEFVNPITSDRRLWQESLSWAPSQRIGGTPGQPGVDADFNADGNVDASDIDLLFAQVAAGVYSKKYDLNNDAKVDSRDVDELLTNVLGTTPGDANLDRLFNSADLVAVFVFGEYEDAIENNSGWASGDWNGDADFTSSDLVLAFQSGRYERGLGG